MTTRIRHRLLWFTYLILVSVTCTKVMAQTTSDSDWPRWRGPNGNGVTADANWDWRKLSDGPKILWNVNIGFGSSNVAIQGGRLYTMGMQGKYGKLQSIVLCLDASTGEEIWRHPVGNTGMRVEYGTMSTPTLEGSFVYTLTPDGILSCLEAADGEVKWERNLITELGCDRLAHEYATSPIVEKELVLLNLNSAGVALNKATGEQVWISAPVEHPILQAGFYATPVLVDRDETRCALLFSDAGLYLVEVLTGKQVWLHPWPPDSGENVADPVVFNGRVFMSTGGVLWAQGALLDMSGTVPKLLWQNGNLGTLYTTSVYHEGFLYGNCGRFRCIDARDGSVAWEEVMKDVTLIVAGEKLILLEYTGKLHVVEPTPSSYTELAGGDLYGGSRAALRIFMTPPAMSNGLLYCRNLFGDLICVDLRK